MSHMSQHIFVKRLTRHADASESASLVDAGALVLAGVGLALVDVDLAPAALEAGRAVATVRAGSVDTKATMLTRRS